MRTNMYPGVCPECSRGVPKGNGYLYGINNVVVCQECVYLFYGRERGYLATSVSAPKPAYIHAAEHYDDTGSEQGWSPDRPESMRRGSIEAAAAPASPITATTK